MLEITPRNKPVAIALAVFAFFWLVGMLLSLLPPDAASIAAANRREAQKSAAETHPRLNAADSAERSLTAFESGNGHDWLRLSDADRVRFGLLLSAKHPTLDGYECQAIVTRYYLADSDRLALPVRTAFAAAVAALQK